MLYAGGLQFVHCYLLQTPHLQIVNTTCLQFHVQLLSIEYLLVVILVLAIPSSIQYFSVSVSLYTLCTILCRVYSMHSY